MALGKYARIDGHNSSNYCVIISIVVFLVTCCIGVWMTMSSSVSPLRLGVTLQQFIGGMPKKASLSNPGSEGHSFEGNASRGIVQDDSNLNMQGNENVIPNVPVSLDSDEKHDVESIDVKDTEVGNYSNSPTVGNSFDLVNGDDNKGSLGESSGSDKGDTSSHEVTTETYVNDALQNNDAGVQSSPAESPSETMQMGKTKAKIDEFGEYQAKSPSDKGAVDAVDIPNELVNQTDKIDQEESKALEGNSVSKPSEPVSMDGEATPNEPSTQEVSLPTESAESKKENVSEENSSSLHQSNYLWKVCNVTAGADYIPCLDNIQAIQQLHSRGHYEHRERHCPDEAPTCLVSLPEGYKTPIKWPKSRDMIWFSNVPHTKLVDYKGKQNWVKVYGRYLTFPGGGTQFTSGARHYIDYLEETLPDISWGKRSRVVLDVGCGVASFGGYLFDRDVLTMSLAPKDEHEAQVQFALERGIPAISAVMGTTRLPFPSMVFDIIHCARCRVPWHIEGGKLLLELNRILRPGGYFVWSATPVYRKDSVNVGIWKDMSELTKSICWELVKVRKDDVNRKAAAIFRKPTSNSCYEGRPEKDPPLCEESDDPNRAWYTPLQSCIHKVPTDPSERGSQWPLSWPLRLEKSPYWLKSETTANNFSNDYNHWKQVIANVYLGSGIDWSLVRNVMDMKASYGGFAAALRDSSVWVMNVVPVNSSDTLPMIYERGLFGIYHDWCESFSTYPRSYDLLHADQLFADLSSRCNLLAVMAEVDRVLRPGGWLVVRDGIDAVAEIEAIAISLHWKVQLTLPLDSMKLLFVQKTNWRPTEVETIASAIGC